VSAWLYAGMAGLILVVGLYGWRAARGATIVRLPAA
jgi:hypothetical protein